MIIDMHIHQRMHSSDSQLDIHRAVDVAKARGLDGICITDHDTLGLRERAQSISEALEFPIFVGVEIYTLDGDLLCFGIDEMPKERMGAQDTIDFVNERGGVTIAAHPFRHNNRGLGNKIRDVVGLGAVEAYNGRTADKDNRDAEGLALSLDLPLSGGSDAHTDFEVGRFATQFLTPVHSEQDMIRAIRGGQIQPVSITEQTKQLETA